MNRYNDHNMIYEDRDGSKLSKVQASRLLDVAISLEEAPHPRRFDMSLFVHNYGSPDNWCGSPACALGHYAARRDLQSKFKILHAVDCIPRLVFGSGPNQLTGSDVFDSDKVLKYFGLSHEGFELLFDEDGCGGANTPKRAAKFIRKFVAKYS